MLFYLDNNTIFMLDRTTQQFVKQNRFAEGIKIEF